MRTASGGFSSCKDSRSNPRCRRSISSSMCFGPTGRTSPVGKETVFFENTAKAKMTKSRHVRSNRQIPAPPQHPAEDEERRFFEPLYAEWIPFHDQRPPTLYHYTTAQGLLGIMESNRLWATNVRFLNDPSEIDYAICIIRESLGSVPLPANFHDQVNYRLDESEAEARVYVC